MEQVMFELDHGRLRPLRQRVEEVLLKQRGASLHNASRFKALEERMLRNWNDCQAALIDLLDRIVVLEKDRK